jgi:UDP-N-acetylmuramate--alanine ligase
MSGAGSDYLVGIGGSGMAPLALLLRAEGRRVRGSDRALGREELRERFERLERAGVELLPQDGTGPAPGDRLVLSSAIEEGNPDLRRARELGLPVQHRSEALAVLFNARRGIAVAGTSGKSTTTAILAHLLVRLGHDPSVMAGSEIHGLDGARSAAARAGSGQLFVIEADESDGSFLRYEPAVGVVANISKDHMEVPQLVELFESFAGSCREAVVLGADCPRAAGLRIGGVRAHRFGLEQGDTRAEHLEAGAEGSRFEVAGERFVLPLPGLHNVRNALAAIAVVRELGLGLGPVAEALAQFRGLHRRFELVGRPRGIEVYDDYAHNPDKLAAILMATEGARRFVLFQPHGYGPTRFLLEELAEALARNTEGRDRVLVLPIYDAGGTADRSIGAGDLAEAVARRGGRAQAVEARAKAVDAVAREARAGDKVLVLGARDASLTTLARQIVEALGG